MWRRGGRRTTHFWPYLHHCKMAVTWLYATFLISIMFILSMRARWCLYLTDSAFVSFFWGCQKSALIAILKTPFGSICFNSWLRCYRCTASSNWTWWLYLLWRNQITDTWRHTAAAASTAVAMTTRRQLSDRRWLAARVCTDCFVYLLTYLSAINLLHPVTYLLILLKTASWCLVVVN